MNLKELGIVNDMGRGWGNGKYQPLWHFKVYKMWRHAWSRIYNDIHYFGCLIHPDFKYLSNFVEWIMSEPRFEDFCNTCDKITWSIDKDMKCPGNRNYYPEYMTLTTKSENTKERNKRKGNPNPKNSIIAIDNTKVLFFESTLDAQDKGFDSRNISKCLNKKQKTHKGYRWYRINYKHNKTYRVKGGN